MVQDTLLDTPTTKQPFSLSIVLLPVVVITATIIEAWFVSQIGQNSKVIGPAIAFHCLSVMLCLLLMRNIHSIGFALFDYGIFLFALFGPFGGLLASVLMQLDGRRQTAKLARWHTTLALEDTPTRQADVFSKIISNRSLDMTHGSPKPFQKIFASGNTQDIKRALSIITLKYKPELLEFLQAALKNEKPEIRVQAAAVYTKLKQRFQNDISEIVTLPAEASTEQRRDAITRLQAAALSQLIDISQRKQMTSTLRKFLKTDVRPEAEKALTLLRADRLIQKEALKEAQLCLKQLTRVKDLEACAMNQRIKTRLERRAVLPAHEQALVN
ncbi:hypothetical protein [Pseudovibrio sp. Ad26]|uniref:hypothetical protein n=1 Tax=Pseudovibrio sp. Ad26 TaxID=989410 RepID=UPI0007AE5C98|nr:hypothetical protein [Pseudovibrio sp. Ad26]KZK99330.1 hypothetical protein PsAD26_05141 [Pseudovibrio sp. Ad26]